MNSLFEGIRSSKFSSGTIIAGLAIGLGGYMSGGFQSNMVAEPRLRQSRGQAQLTDYNRNMSYAAATYKPRHSYRHAYSDNQNRQSSSPQGLALV